MTLNLTRGGLSPATITNTITNEVVKFMFNPYEYTISKSNTWQDKPVSGLNLPMVTFQQGGAQTLNLTLHFDSQALKADVRGYTAPLWKMMMINEAGKSQRSGKGEPPPVTFEWGKLHFKAVITSMSEKFTVFTDTGTPVRCTVEVSLRQYLDEADVPPQMPQGGGGRGAAQSKKVVQGERLDHIAASQGGGAANYRQIAADNNINNPLNVPSGTSLKVNKKR
ncbi:MAG: phage tail protein [Anaerolineae bacterium]|nr:phage tail protein [Anaerolineae bacterium]